MSSNKYRKLNKIIVRKCMEFYGKCWKHRNEAYHDAERQKERIKKWFLKEREKAVNSDMQQVRNYVRKFEINEERSDVEKLKKWIMNLKKLERRIEKVLKNDIRRYMIV